MSRKTKRKETSWTQSAILVFLSKDLNRVLLKIASLEFLIGFGQEYRVKIFPGPEPNAMHFFAAAAAQEVFLLINALFLSFG